MDVNSVEFRSFLDKLATILPDEVEVSKFTFQRRGERVETEYNIEVTYVKPLGRPALIGNIRVA